MAYDSSGEDYRSGKSGVATGPHPDVDMNLQYALAIKKNYTFKDSMKYIITNEDPRTTIITPIAASFYWTDSQGKHGCPVSMHQPYSKFKQEIDNCIHFCVRNDYAVKEAPKPWSRKT